MGDSGQICKAVLSTILTKTPTEVFWIMWCPCFLYESMLKCTAAVLMTQHLTKTFSFPLICQPFVCSAPFRSVLLTPLKSYLFFIFYFSFTLVFLLITRTKQTELFFSYLDVAVNRGNPCVFEKILSQQSTLDF